MFGFGSCLGIANTLGYNYILKSTFPMWKYFQIKKQPKKELTNLITLTAGNWWDDNWKKDSTILSNNLTLTGYFQAWTYFKDMKDELMKHFTIKRQYLEKVRQFMRDSVPELRLQFVCTYAGEISYIKVVKRKEGRLQIKSTLINQ